MSVSAEALRAHIGYTAWASGRLLAAAARLAPHELTRNFATADRSVLGTLFHVFFADRLWLARFQGEPQLGPVPPEEQRLEFLESEWPRLHERWVRHAATWTDTSVREPLAYTSLSGQPWEQPLWQLVMHVVNHGTHHRGQAAGFLRSMGHEPPPIDLVVYYREFR